MKRIILTVACLLLLNTIFVFAQVAHDGEAGVTCSLGTPGTSITCSSKTTAGTNRVGIFACVVSNAPGTLSPTWNSVAMTDLGSVTNATDGRESHLWWIAAPPTAASNVVLGTVNNSTMVCSASSFNGAHQTVQDGTAQSASGTTDPASVTCPAGVDEFIVDSLYFLGAGTPPAAGTGVTANTGSPSDQGTWFGANGRQDGNNATSDLMSWTLTTPTRWSHLCNVIKAAAASGGATNAMMGFMK